MDNKISIFLFLLGFLTLSGQNKQDDILGMWMADDKSVSVKIYKEDQTFKAKIMWFNINLGSGKPIHTRTDSHNPNPNLRHRKIIGMDVLSNFIFNKEKNRWDHGKIYDASSGRTWEANAVIKDNNHLCVRGFWKWAWIGKSMCFNKM